MVGLTESREDKQGKHVLYISWAPHCSRSDNTARELGGESRMVYADWLGSNPLTVGIRLHLTGLSNTQTPRGEET